jgi:RHS repeat-associated protein
MGCSELPRPSIYSYDVAGNLTSSTETFGPPLSYERDANGALIRLRDTDGVVDLTFERDPAGRLASVTDSDWQDPAQTFRFIREEAGQVDNLYRIEASSGLVTRFSYDSNRRLTGTSAELGGQIIAHFGYGYRPDGLMGSISGDRSGTFGYDGLKQLTEETDAGLRNAYDARGNRLWRAALQPATAGLNSYDSDNRVVGLGDGTSFSHDADANLLLRKPAAGDATHYEYDGANRLRRVVRGTLTLEYIYDYTGRLIERRRTENGNTAVARYAYANTSILAVLDEAGEPVDVFTRSDRGRLLRRRSATPLAPAPQSDPHTLFYVLDGLNSVVRLVDGGSDQKLSRSFDAWGNPASSGASFEEPFAYRSAFRDPDTKLLRFGRRWYDPSLGRWLTEDPLLTDVLVRDAAIWPAIEDLSNLYAYVGNDPLNWMDPGGLGVWDWIKERAREVVAAVIAGKEPDWTRGGQPKGPKPEEVRRKAPNTGEDEVGEQPEEYPEGAGEGSRAPSTERSYAKRAARIEVEGVDVAFWAKVGIIGYGLWTVGKWGVALLAAPETGGASLAGAAALP